MARRVLTDHREVFAALARPDFETIAGSPAMASFRSVVAELESALREAGFNVTRKRASRWFEIPLKRYTC